MEKEILIRELNYISKVYFEKGDYVSASQINRAIDVVEDYYGNDREPIQSTDGRPDAGAEG